ncbi:hypothetical protein GCM10027051_36790 [Niabella terrae]
MNRYRFFKWFPLLLLLGVLYAFSLKPEPRPVLYIIGDSTVKNGSGRGADQLWGWGSCFAAFFDTNRIEIQNHAIGGRSSRTFITDGRWDRIMAELRKGDYVIMQFGHNDGSPLDDTARARGTIRGIGEDSAVIYNPICKVRETVYSYGHYMRRYIKDVQSVGAVPIICSPVPRNNFKDGKTRRATGDYGGWARKVAEQTGAYFIDLNSLIADAYDEMGPQQVSEFFPKDHTHTNLQGATLNAAKVAEGLVSLSSCDLKSYLQTNVKRNEAE